MQVFTDNPLTEFVELPEDFKDLKYCNVLCGVIRGSLEMVSEDNEWMYQSVYKEHVTVTRCASHVAGQHGCGMQDRSRHAQRG
jgi:hypothetical protein